MEDDRRALISVERNIANIERSLSASGGGILNMAAAANAVRSNHHAAEARGNSSRGLNKLLPGGRSTSLGRRARAGSIPIAVTKQTLLVEWSRV